MRQTIVITGCSSGFGRLTALSLASEGWKVFGTVRKEEDREALMRAAEALGCAESISIHLCDILSEEQVRTFAMEVEQNLGDGRLAALLNNAGTAYGGPLEVVPLPIARKQFEINVLAQLQVTQSFLPMLKAAQGTIINVSSVSGKIVLPMLGLYSMSKFALEAMSDALRNELAPFGVRVSVIEPASSATNIWETSEKHAEQHLDPAKLLPYAKLQRSMERIVELSKTQGFPPIIFVNTVKQILRSRRPRARYLIPGSSRVQFFLLRFLNTGLIDFIIRRIMNW